MRGKGGPTLLTISGAITQSNRGALDATIDQMMGKHGVQFSRAHSFDAAALQRLPAVSIRTTLEYDNQLHQLSGPLVATVLGAAGANGPVQRLHTSNTYGVLRMDAYAFGVSTIPTNP